MNREESVVIIVIIISMIAFAFLFNGEPTVEVINEQWSF